MSSWSLHIRSQEIDLLLGPTSDYIRDTPLKRISSLAIESLESRCMLSASQLVTDSRGRSVETPLRPTVSGDQIYFTADSSRYGRELWIADGDSGEARLVKDISPRSKDSNPENLTPVGEKLFFTATTEETGRELWVTDGTEDGTRLVQDIRDGAEDGVQREPRTHQDTDHPIPMANADSILYFVADDGAHGTELWKSDGTESGTVMIKDLGIDGETAAPSNLTVVANKLFFSLGSQLWLTDGTETGTELVKDLASAEPAEQTAINNILEFGNTAYFTTESPAVGTLQLWKSDGTPSTGWFSIG